MDFQLETRSLTEIPTDLVVVGVFQDEPPLEALGQLEPNLNDELVRAVEDACDFEAFRGKSKECLVIRVPSLSARRLALVGLGKKTAFDANAARRLAASLARQFGGKESCKTICLFLRETTAQTVQVAVEGFVLGSYSFVQYKASENGDLKNKISVVSFAGSSLEQEPFELSVRAGRAIADATTFARDMVAEPACVMTPSRLAQIACSLATENMTCTILEEDQVREMGMGAFLGVSRGSHEPPKFVVLKYTPAKHKGKMRSVALIGKGITFDSGGLSLKTAQGMETMKADMAGAAAVLGTMKVVAEMAPPVSVMAVVAACENMPGGGATRPGDVLVAMNGKTIEVNNTDAEGRLTLADALCYVTKEKPNIIIDIATLTGAVVGALGKAAAGIMGNNQQLIDHFLKATVSSGERFWQLPLYEDYRESLKSDVADLKNAGSRGEAVSSSAGMFLREFVDGIPWIHMDVLGPAWMDKDKDELNKGGTGFGVRSMSYFLLSDIVASRVKENPESSN